MSVSAAVAGALVEHSQVGVMALIGIYLSYEIRVGAMEEVRQNQRTIGVGLYRVIDKDPHLDEEQFRRELWGENGDEGMLPSDLDLDDPPSGGD